MNTENVENREKVAEVINVMNRNVNTLTERAERIDQAMPPPRIIHVTHKLPWGKILLERLILRLVVAAVIIPFALIIVWLLGGFNRN